jgi:cytochrome c oxidase assembly protein subunit 15
MSQASIASGEGSGQRGSRLTIAFGASVVLWLIIYLAAMPGDLGTPWLVLATILAAATLGAAGWIAGRAAGANAAGGALVGLLIGLVHLLVLGSILRDGSGALVTGGIVSTIGFFAVAVILGAVGAALGRRDAPPAAINWTGWLALVLAVAAGLMMAVGGVVTARAELMTADADGFSEHAHRLWGLLVGLTSIVLVVHVFRAESRRGVRWLALGILGAVILQGVLGGTRVLGESIALAIAHGVFAQIVFASIVAIAVITSTAWVAPDPPHSIASGAKLRANALALLMLLLVQLTVGAIYRHLQTADVTAGMLHGVLAVHLITAIAVALHTILVGGRAWGGPPEFGPLRSLGGWLMLVLALQFALGIGALVAVLLARAPDDIPLYEILLTTAHQTNGAVLLALATATMLWTRRLVAPGGAGAVAAVSE